MSEKASEKTPPAADVPVIELIDAKKIYKMGDEYVHALDGVSVKIFKGEFIAILGPSGSGKSTMMNMLGFMDTLTSGTMIFEGKDVSHAGAGRRAWYRANRIGFIFQAFNLLPRLSVLENVMLPLTYSKVPRKEADRRAREALSRVALDHRISHIPSQLSGGERQRVATARAIVNNPGVILADEPTGNLDSKNVARTLALLCSLRDSGLPVVMVTHDLEVSKAAGRVVSMRDGKILEDYKQ
ncbi:MAG: ABC transporter ATP-binding protein [Opitutae bacterium]|nr:ABC transporter ATP-binding protein [Opitutae bacterium]MCD8299196.1 ABC transporter ATP-binding protein [Opitutae bacterium]